MKLTGIINTRYTPRWIIIFIDILLIFFSAILSFLLRVNFAPDRINPEIFFRGILIIVGIYLISFLCFRSYKEIIRHTTFHGIFQILYVVIAANAGLLALHLISEEFFNVILVPYSIIVINFFIE